MAEVNQPLQRRQDELAEHRNAHQRAGLASEIIAYEENINKVRRFIES